MFYYSNVLYLTSYLFLSVLGTKYNYQRICSSNRIKNIIESCIVFRAEGVYGLPKMCRLHDKQQPFCHELFMKPITSKDD
jgi:hypothetical protein